MVVVVPTWNTTLRVFGTAQEWLSGTPAFVRGLVEPIALGAWVHGILWKVCKFHVLMIVTVVWVGLLNDRVVNPMLNRATI